VQRVLPLFLSVFLIGAGWLGVAALAGAKGGFDTLLVPIAQEGFLDRLPMDVSIVDITGSMLVLRGDGETLASNLLAAGAIIVLPARAKTCLDLVGY
jgi:hypothetical protein